MRKYLVQERQLPWLPNYSLTTKHSQHIRHYNITLYFFHKVVQQDFRPIVDLVLVLAAAAAGGLFASLLRQPVILGYLLGGIVVGPAGLGLIKELIQVDTLAEFGVAFLLFALGVEFSVAERQKVKAISLGGGACKLC
jgi:CPA2 family monovalent cation:H+ antiporter-2